MTSPLRVGVVGAGTVAQVAHLPVLSRMKDVQVVSVCDNDLAKAQALASRFGIADAFDDIEDLLRLTRPDAVAICTPNHLHEVHTMRALRSGAHVLCERPLALAPDGIERIMTTQHHGAPVVMAAMNQRYRSDVQAVRSFLRGGELGALKAIRAGWHIYRPLRVQAEWRRRRAESGGGAMFDLGLPLLDVALWLAGHPRPRHVTAAVERTDPAGGIEESGCALLVCEDGLSIFIDVSWRHVSETETLTIDLHGDRGSASVAPLQVYKEMHGTPVNVTPTGAAGRENAFAASYRSEWAHFVAAVRGTLPPPNLDEQIALHRLLAAIYRSVEEGRGVSL